MTDRPFGASAAGAEGDVPVCPRHPERVSYVRCQRCERPVCPECQRSAAVGVQCVDCVRAHARGSQPRTLFGGVVQAKPANVTFALIGICAVVFLGQWIGGSEVTARYSFVPALAVAEPYRFLTSAFLHSPQSVLHILFNMYALWVLGAELEPLLGRARYLALYLISAVGGSVGFLLLARPDYEGTWMTSTVGASGAVFGLFAAVVVVNRRLRRSNAAMIGIIVVNLVLGFAPGMNIAWQAHLGGLVTGLLVILGLTRSAAVRRPGVAVLSVGAVVALLVALVAFKVMTVPAGLLL